MSWMSESMNTVMKVREDGDIEIENAVIIWKNFSGRPTPFDSNGGKRTFTLVLNPEMAAYLKEAGWNVKMRQPREEGDDPLMFTEIAVRFNPALPKYQPKIKMVTDFGGEKTIAPLTEETISILDEETIVGADMILHPYEHGRNVGGSSVKGYLRVLYATVAQDDFGGKYASIGTQAQDNEMPF